MKELVILFFDMTLGKAYYFVTMTFGYVKSGVTFKRAVQIVKHEIKTIELEYKAEDCK